MVREWGKLISRESVTKSNELLSYRFELELQISIFVEAYIRVGIDLVRRKTLPITL
jgi:hypothetical protein